MNTIQKLKKFVDEFIVEDISALEKSYISMYGGGTYYAVKGSSILNMGWSLPQDVTFDAESASKDKYVLIIAREGKNSWSPNYTIEMIAEGEEDSIDANEKALNLVDDNKNNINSVSVCLNTGKKFAGRTVYLATSVYQHISKSDDVEDAIEIKKIYDTVEDIPPAAKKLSGNKSKQWLEVWNSIYKKTKNEKRAFAGAWSVVQKDAQPDVGDLHVDALDKKVSTCPTCGKPMDECTCDDKNVKKENFEFEVELKKENLVKNLVYGIVYEPMREDTHKDWTSSTEIENAAHNFLPSAMRTAAVKKGETWTNVNHKDEVEDVEIVESYVAPCDFKFPSGEAVYKGSWVLVSRVNNEDLKKSIEDGEITGYSLEGTAKRLDLTLSKENKENKENVA